MKQISALVSEGKIEMYEAEIGRTYQSSKEYRDLSTEETLAVILSSRNRVWSLNDEARVMHYLIVKSGYALRSSGNKIWFLRVP
jgi:hypothetical protein